MALIKCPDCNTEVSDSAAACIRCGRPMHKTDREDDREERGRATAGMAIKGFFAATGLGFITTLSTCGSPDKPGEIMITLMVSLFFGLIGAVMGAAIGRLRS